MLASSDSPTTSIDSSPNSTDATEYACSTRPSSTSIDRSDLSVALADLSLESRIALPLSDEERAAVLKIEGDAAFEKGQFEDAADLYKEAIRLNSLDATLHCNRALAHIRLDWPSYAIADCILALNLDPSNVKAYYRRGICRLDLGYAKLALEDFEKVLLLDPTNNEARRQYTKAQKMIQRLRFEKAIKLREEPNVIEQCYETIAQSECTVDENYAGPILPFVSQPDLSGTERSYIPKGRYSITLEFVTEILKWYADGKVLPRRYVWEIILSAYDAFKNEESMVEVTIGEEQTASIIGDVHGQFYDYLHLLSLTGFPSENHIFLMNGDLVDRGAWSIEIIVTAFALKWLYPNRMFINRGNHETRCMNASYGFKTETVQKYDEMTYELFAHVFTALPLATMINASRPFPSSHLTRSEKTIEGFAAPTPLILSPLGCKRYFVTHGGLFSRDDVTLDDVRNIPRLGREPGPEGLMAEMLWTDPQDGPGRGPNDRGGGLMFGPDVSFRWCTLNKVTGIFRSHQLREDGFAVEHDGLCITVFSAPKYADKYDNKGAFIRVDSSGGLEFIQFEAQPHPTVKPIVVDD